MGIICLELDDLMKDKLGEITNYKSNQITSRKYFQSVCRIPDSYIKFLAIQNIKFIPIYYTNNTDKIYLKQMDYLDGIWLTGGAINENFIKMQN